MKYLLSYKNGLVNSHFYKDNDQGGFDIMTESEAIDRAKSLCRELAASAVLYKQADTLPEKYGSLEKICEIDWSGELVLLTKSV